MKEDNVLAETKIALHDKFSNICETFFYENDINGVNPTSIYETNINGVNPTSLKQYNLGTYSFYQLILYPCSTPKVVSMAQYQVLDMKILKEIEKKKITLNKLILQYIFDYIYNIRKQLRAHISIVLGNSGLRDKEAEELNAFYFKDLVGQLKDNAFFDCNNEIQLLYSLRKDSRPLHDDVIVIELLSTSSHIKNIKNRIPSIGTSRRLSLFYISIFYQMDETEKQIIFEQYKEDSKKIEQTKKEYEKIKQPELLETLQLCVKDWDFFLSVIKSFIRHHYFVDYLPTTIYTENKQDWECRYLVWNFKNKKNKLKQRVHLEIIDDIVEMTYRILMKTFGNHINKLTLACIPASTETQNKVRFQEFSSRLCAKTGMTDSFSYINITHEKRPSHEGGKNIDNYTLDETFFTGKYIVIFDDLLTSGKSTYLMCKKMNDVGAHVICAIYLGKTFKPDKW